MNYSDRNTPKKALKNTNNNVFKNLNHVERITNNYLKYHYILKTLCVNSIKLELSSLDHYPRFHHTKWSSIGEGTLKSLSTLKLSAEKKITVIHINRNMI